MTASALTADRIIALLGLQPHPEGGHFVETFRDAPGEGGLTMRMPDGPAVFTAAVDGMVRSGRKVLAQAGLGAAEIATWAPHQANKRIVARVGQTLGLERAEWLGTLHRHGNSSAATIPLALSCRVAEGGPLRPGPILLSAFGAGTLWGSLIWRL